MPSAVRPPLNDTDAALMDLLMALSAAGYHFITPTDATHRRILRRPRGPGRADLRDVFGWNRTFAEHDLPADILTLMRRARILTLGPHGLRSRLRVASLDDHLFLHSSFPTHAEDAVFFGPDSYRFAKFLRAHLTDPAIEGNLVDVGAGCGAGGLVAVDIAPRMSLIMSDINPKALRLARINAGYAGVQADLIMGAGLEGVTGPVDVVIANPPYIAGRPGQTYQNGGEGLGAQVAIDWARGAMTKLKSGGRMLLYTGAAIVRGEDRLKAELARAAKAQGCSLDYQELDPDVFGEELRRPAYGDVERIAAVGVVLARL